MSTFIEPPSPKGPIVPSSGGSGPKQAAKASTPSPNRAPSNGSSTPKRRGSNPDAEAQGKPARRSSKPNGQDMAAGKPARRSSKPGKTDSPPSGKNKSPSSPRARPAKVKTESSELFRSPISPKKNAHDILVQYSKSGDNLEAIFNETGIPIIQHKFRKALMGNIGSKPRRLILSNDSSQIGLVKRGANSNLRESVEEGDGELNRIKLSEIVKITPGLSTPELKKSIRRREKTEKKIAIASSRCFTIHWRSGLRPSWDLEVAVGAEGFPTIAATPEAATKLCDSLVEFLIAVAAGAMGGDMIDFSLNGASPVPGSDKSSAAAEETSTPKNASKFGVKGGAKGSAKDDKQFTFRERRLSITEDESGELITDDMMKDEDGELYMAKEMDKKLNIVTPETGTVTNAAGGAGGGVNKDDIPFNTSLCGTYSCHGIEQKFSRTGIQVKAKINQDRGGIQHPFGGRKDMAFFCVMDGHGRGGEKISEYCMTNLPKLLANHPSLLSNPGLALKESVVDVDNDLRKFLAREATFAGTTCICVLAIGDTLVIANSGDSRAVLGMVDPTSPNRVLAKDLSFDHKPDTPEEAARVRAMGGFVSMGSPERGPSRVWLNKAMNSCGLAMARSLGDHALANVGVISEPEITMHTLGPHDRYLIMGSDGIFEFIESKNACDIVHSVMNKKDGDCEKACRLLIEKSVISWKTHEGDYRDDITGIVVKLPCFKEEDITPLNSSVVGSKF